MGGRILTIAPSRVRRITPAEADAAYAILCEHVGAHDHPDARWAFVHFVADEDSPCEEYRFCGSLGFGGKFRNNGNRNGVPYVDCYREHETPKRLVEIERVNGLLLDLFVPPTTNTGDGDGR